MNIRKIFDIAAVWKRIDIAFQCIMFAATVFAVFFSQLWLFGLYIMGLSQLLSSVIWLVVFCWDKQISKSNDSILIRVIMVLTFLILLFLICFNNTDFVSVSCYMLFIGPVIGGTYFVISIAELKYYSKARKPYYLL